MSLSHVATLPRRLVVWLCRFRQRRGYGIHSPFAFSFVTGVVYERGTYYAYAGLHAARRGTAAALRECDDRLLLRLANAVQPRHALVWGKRTALTLRYLKAGCPGCDYLQVTATETTPPAQAVAGVTPVDLLYVDDAKAWPALVWGTIGHVGPKACFVIRHIHRDRTARSAWRRFCRDERVRVSFDLYDFGIAFFEARLNKQDYTVNYF